MFNRRRKLREVANLLPWLGLGLLITCLVVLFLNRQIDSFVQLPQLEQREVIPGVFDTVVIDPGHGRRDKPIVSDLRQADAPVIGDGCDKR